MLGCIPSVVVLAVFIIRRAVGHRAIVHELTRSGTPVSIYENTVSLAASCARSTRQTGELEATSCTVCSE